MENLERVDFDENSWEVESEEVVREESEVN